MSAGTGNFPKPILYAVCAAAALLGGLSLFSGCSSFEHRQYIFWGDAVMQHPETIEDHWSDYGPFLPDDRSKKMRRGKAGVIRFYKKGDLNRSVPVDGELVVYVFEGNGGGVELTEPKYKLVVDSEKLNRQRKFDKENGYSYHIWLDLGEVDQPAEAISILSVFTENKTREQVASGVTYTQIGGEPTQEVLPSAGLKKSLAEKSADPNAPAFRDSGAESGSSPAETPKESDSNQLLSVNLSESLASHLAAAPPEPPQQEEPRLPLKTAYLPPETVSEPDPAHPEKLSFDQLRSIGGPQYGTNSYFSQGVTSPAPAADTGQTSEPNLLEPQTGSAKALLQ